MNKQLLLLLSTLLLIVLLTLSACSTQGEAGSSIDDNATSGVTDPSETEAEELQYFDNFSALIVGGGIESACGVSCSGDIELTSSSWIDENASNEQTISWNGEDVVLSYVETCSEYLYQETYHVYENREKYVKIRVNAFNNQITFFTSYAPIPVNPEHPVYTEEELYDVAYSFLCEKVRDPENYRITKQELFVEEGLSDELMLEFSRMIDGVPTSDSITVYASNGQIGLYKIQNLGQMAQVTPLTLEQLSKIESVVSSKVDHLYQNTDSKYEFTHLETAYKIIRMSDGRMAIRCYPVVEVVNSETDVSFEDVLDLLIYLN